MNTVSYFARRVEASARANAYTRATDQQHDIVRTEHGWLVRNAVTKDLFDSRHERVPTHIAASVK